MKYFLIFITIIMFGCSTNEVESAKKLTFPTEEKPTSSIIQNGDIIFHTSLSSQSMAIQIATKSDYSHVGIIYKKDGQLYVYEAVEPVKLTPFKEWIARGKDGHYIVKRLKNSQAFLTDEGILKMKKVGQKYLGQKYDVQFEWSDDKIYCSELVWKIYKEAFNIEIGTLQQIKDFDLSNDLVKSKLKERYGSNIPMEEFVITPDRMFNAGNLITVVEE